MIHRRKQTNTRAGYQVPPLSGRCLSIASRTPTSRKLISCARSLAGPLRLDRQGRGSASVSLLLGDGKGGFSTASELAVSETPWSVAVGDFNGDRNADLAVASDGCEAFKLSSLSICINQSQ